MRTPYRSYDVLAKWDSVSWNDATRDVVKRRLASPPERRFLSEDEWRLLEAIADRIVPQPDRAAPVPIAPWIDERLHENRGDGFRFDGMPKLREAWRLGLRGIAREAERRYGRAFVDLADAEKDAILAAVQKGAVTDEPWDRLPAERFFKDTLLRGIVLTYYAHPAAWSECGFGGPASPRGYVRLEANRRDAWEAKADER